MVMPSIGFLAQILRSQGIRSNLVFMLVLIFTAQIERKTFRNDKEKLKMPILTFITLFQHNFKISYVFYACLDIFSVEP